MRTTLAAGTAMLLLLVGCSAEPEQWTAERYYEALDVGDYAQASHDELDEVGKLACEDLESRPAEERSHVLVLVREGSVDTMDDARAVLAAITGRWCPQYTDDVLG